MRTATYALYERGRGGQLVHVRDLHSIKEARRATEEHPDAVILRAERKPAPPWWQRLAERFIRRAGR